jgi:hypothetical protein
MHCNRYNLDPNRMWSTYRAEGSSEQQNVGFRLVRSVVLPSSALLHAQVAPLKLSQSSVLGEVSGVVLGKDDVSVLVLAVLVLLRVFNLLGEQIRKDMLATTLPFHVPVHTTLLTFVAIFINELATINYPFWMNLL